MRLLLLAIIIVLLPLRGWVGDAMAMQMAAQGLSQKVANAGAAAAHTDEVAAPVHWHSDAPQTDATPVAGDCAGHAGSGNPSSPELSHCQSCVACQVCSV